MMVLKSNIDNNYNKKYFSENDSDNNKQYESLLRKLNSAYPPKFIEQVYHIFNDIQWDRKDRNLIKNEVNRLQNIKGFDNSRDVKNKLNDVETILSKYSEIADFIWNSNKISYTVHSFPLKEVRGIINKTNNYLHKNLDNSYVNNSGYLHNGLNNIFRKLFDKHISYLQERIELNLYEYKKYDQCSNFFKEIVNPLVDELTVINNKIYNVDDIYFNQQFNMILYKLNDIETDAIQYFESQN